MLNTFCSNSIYRRWKLGYDWEEIVSRFWFVTVTILKKSCHDYSHWIFWNF